LANLLATEQVHLGDLVCIDWDGTHKQLTFVREGEGALVQNQPPDKEQIAAGAEVKDGRKAEVPAEAITEGKKPRTAPAAAAPAAAPQARKKPER
jgi:hypothetical protein